MYMYKHKGSVMCYVHLLTYTYIYMIYVNCVISGN